MYNQLMNAVCPNCGESVYNTHNLDEQLIVCSNCGVEIKARFSSEPMKNIGVGDNTDLNQRFRDDDRLRYPELSLKVIFGFIANFAILFFIIILLTNFFAYFPAFALTAPELVREHSHELVTQLPVFIDNTPPDIEYSGARTIYLDSGQIFTITAKFTDDHLREGYLEFPELGNMQIRFKNNGDSDTFYAQFQAPERPGNYNLSMNVFDYANNSEQIDLDMIVSQNNEPYLKLLTPVDIGYMNSTTEIIFKRWSNDISSVSYTINMSNESIPLTSGQSLSTLGWPEGEVEVALNIETKAGRNSYQNYSIMIDNTKPVLEDIIVKPLTISRNDTFRNRLGNKYYYRGELARITLNLTEENLASALVSINHNKFSMVRIGGEHDNSTVHIHKEPKKILYQTVCSLPTKPGDYTLKIITTDRAGNQQSFKRDIKIARVNFDYYPIPILKLESTTGSNDRLPLLNKLDKININTKFGEISQIEYMNTNQLNISTKNGDNINISELPEGHGYLKIKAKVTYLYWTNLFITFPVPPFLFVLPVLFTGWLLFGFYCFIAASIIISYLVLFKQSFKGAFKELHTSFSNSSGPPIRSKNTILMVAQLFIATLSFHYVYNIILSFSNVETHVPDFSALSPWALIFDITTAAVYEEIISRILLIGIPLFFIHKILKKYKDHLCWRYIFGGEFKIDKITIFLILFSSITFGLAHSPGWDYWKVLPSLVTGLAMGYLYVTKGVYASILLHFSINFLQIPLLITNNTPVLQLSLSIFLLIWLFVGIGYLFYYLKIIFSVFTKSKSINAPSNL